LMNQSRMVHKRRPRGPQIDPPRLLLKDFAWQTSIDR
jgi:hypothetical protein